MYSKSKGMTDRDYTLTPPPGYDGSRFRRRSDGRDDTFPLYGEKNVRNNDPRRCRQRQKPQTVVEDCQKDLPKNENSEDEFFEDCSQCDCPESECRKDEEAKELSPVYKKEGEKEKDHGVLSFLQNLGSEEILLIALIVLLCNDQSQAGMETVLLLALLLCIS